MIISSGLRRMMTKMNNNKLMDTNKKDLALINKMLLFSKIPKVTIPGPKN